MSKVYVQCPICKTVLLADWDNNINSRYRCVKCGIEPYFNNTILPALSVRQPWSHLICIGLKDIENRTRRTNFRGRVLIHASAKLCSGSLIDIFTEEQWDCLEESGFVYEFLFKDKHPIFCKSAIIGSVEIVDCVRNHPSIWAEHKAYKKVKKDGIVSTIEVPVYNWVLANPVLFKEPILNVKGQLGFFKPKIE